MIELIKFFRILFLSKNISRERLKDFTESHIQRLIGNNPGGIFTGILTAVTTAYNDYFGDMSSEALNLSVQEGKTIAMNESRMALEALISDNEKLIAYTYRTNNPAYEEFYPLGITEYNQASISNMETISLRYKNVLASHAADFAPAFITNFNTVLQTFVDNRAAQQLAMGKVSGERSDLAVTKPALAKQLTINLLTIALQYVGDESKCDVYFDQSILDEAFAEADREMVADIDPGQTINIFSNISTATLTLIAKNTGSVPLVFGFMANDSDPVPNTVDPLVPGQETGSNAGQGGWTPDKKFLNVTNYGLTMGSFSVKKA